jgi:tripartite-type tricarboxylate transporter receptor subunit TctC
MPISSAKVRKEIVMSGAFAFRMAVAPIVAAIASGLPCAAQDYPTRPITIMVGFAAGGFADGVARVLGANLSERLGQNVVIENRGGGGGNIAAAAVAKVAADGYTLLVTTTGLAINETLSKQKNFSLHDFSVVAIPVWAPETMSVNPKSAAKTLADLLRAASEKPISYASPGVGTSGHIATAYFFKNLAKVEAVHVPFQGGAPAVNAMLGGHVDALVGAVPGYAGQLKSGLIRGLAVAAQKRLPEFPDIPTYAESGFPEIVASTWVGVFAPAKVDDAVIEKLNKTINEIVNEPSAQAQFRTLQTEIRQSDRADAASFFRREVEQWKKMIVSIDLASQ